MQNTLSLPVPSLRRTSLYGDFSSRFVAFLVDTSILLFIYTLVFYPFAGETLQFSTWTQDISPNGVNIENFVLIGKGLFFNFYLLIIHWLYYTLLEASPKQATIGKYALGMKVTELRGKRITLLTANLRYFSKLLSIATFGLGFFLILKYRRSQMLHDYIAKTVIIADH